MKQPGRMPRVHAVFIALAALLSLWCAEGAQAVTCSTKDCILDMSSTIYVMNLQWGISGATGSSSITVNSETSWSTSWDFDRADDWTVTAYLAAILGWEWGYRLPNTGFPVQLSSHTPIHTSVTFDYVPDPSCQPGGLGGGGTGSRVCRLNVAYDAWLHDNPDGTGSCPGDSQCPIYEMMVWLAYSDELFAGTPAEAYAEIGGHRWKVIRSQGGSSPVATFLVVDGNPQNLNQPIDVSGATLNITDFTDWLINNNWVPATWWIDSVQLGTEVVKGKGTLNVTNYAATVGGSVTGPVSINAGGPAVAPFVADTHFSGGTPVTNWTGAIDTSAVTDPAPQAVYQSERYGAMTYTIPGLTPGATYDVRLHFAENFFASAGQRVFDVAINGTTVLASFDIFATAGAAHKADIRAFSVTANASGQIVIGFTDVVNFALINGIQVLAPSGNTHGGAWAMRAVTTATASWTNTWQVANVAPNSAYVAGCWIKGSGAVVLRVFSGNWAAEITRQTVTATSAWQMFSVNVSTGSNTQLTFNLTDGGGVAGTAYLDDCFLGVSGGTNVLANPGFESGNTVWSIEAGAPFSIVQNP